MGHNYFLANMHFQRARLGRKISYPLLGGLLGSILFSSCQSTEPNGKKLAGNNIEVTDTPIAMNPGNEKKVEDDVVSVVENDGGLKGKNLHGNKNSYVEEDLLAILGQENAKGEQKAQGDEEEGEDGDEGDEAKDSANELGGQKSTSVHDDSFYKNALAHENNQYVQKWIKYFTEANSSRERFSRYIKRGYVYKDVIEEVLVRYNIPKEFFYLALIESGFATSATSSAKAVGIWQFIKGTANRYGLEVNSFVDERRDPVRSTIAAANYLNDLFRVYQDWNLAMAGYNAGEVRVMRAVMNTSERDFWTLIEQGRLPAETMNYVPKFIAAVIIGENLEKYGFSVPKVEKYPSIQSLSVRTPFSILDIAQANGISPGVLKQLNPNLKRNTIVSNRGKYHVWIPKGEAGKLGEMMSYLPLDDLTDHNNQIALTNKQKSPKKAHKKNSLDKKANALKFHRVRSGETLAMIAQKYELTIGELKKVNKLRTNRISVGKKLKIPVNVVL